MIFKFNIERPQLLINSQSSELTSTSRKTSIFIGFWKVCSTKAGNFLSDVNQTGKREARMYTTKAERETFQQKARFYPFFNIL